MNHEPNLLLVDDSDNDLVLMRMAFQKAQFNNPLSVVNDGEQAIAYLHGLGTYADRAKSPMPGAVLLDLNMPKKSGFEVLAWARTQPVLKRVPFVILTASMRLEDVERAFDLGASSFLVKPSALEELVSMIRCLRDWLHINYFPPFNEFV